MMWFNRKNTKKCSKNSILRRFISMDAYDISAIRSFLYTCLVLVSLIAIPITFVQSAVSVFTQGDWNIENATSLKTEPITGWTEFSSKDNGVVIGADVRLQPVDYILTQESDDGTGDTCAATGCSTAGGFNAGTATNTVVLDTGTSAHIKLATTAANGNPVTNFGSNGLVRSNPGAGTQPEEINAIAINSTHTFTAGYDSSLGNDQQWRIEKRNIVKGEKDNTFGSSGVVTQNPNIGTDAEQITAIAIDTTHVYVAGYASSSNNSVWRIEKRKIADGALETAFDTDGILESDPSSGDDRINAMAIDSTHIYLAGYDSLPGNSRWRIEKRDITTGALVDAFDTDGIVLSNEDAGSEEIKAMAIDATHIYVAGYDSAPGNQEWKIEKRDITTGALVAAFDADGVIQHNPSSGSDEISAIAINGTHLFLVGHDSSPGNAQWRIEKRSITTGALDTSFDTDGIVLSNPSSDDEHAKAIAIDANYVFVGGTDKEPGDFQWRMESRDITDGSLVTIFGTNGVLLQNRSNKSEEMNALSLDAHHLYAVGYEDTFGTPRWRMEKRFARKFVTSGTFESAVLDLGGNQDIADISWLPASALPGTTLTVKVQAGTTNVSDCPGSCATWTDLISVTSGTNTGAIYDNKRYIKYKATLTTTNTFISPRLNKLNINFSNFPIGAGLVSAVFDTGNTNNFLKSVSWTETGAAPLDVRLQIATSGNNVNWDYCGTATCSTTDWLDFTASPNNYYSVSGDLTNIVSSDAVNDRYFKYKVWLVSDGTATPTVDGITVNYDSAELNIFAPDGTSSTYAPTAGIPFNIVVKAQDSGGAALPDHDGSVTLKLSASLGQPNLSTCTSSFTDADNTEYSTTGTYSSGTMTISNVVLCDATTPGFTISAVETSGGGLTSVANLSITSVNLDAASLQLAFAAQPPTTFLASADLNPAPKVHLQDQYGNIDTTESTAVTLSAFSDSLCVTPALGVFNSTSVGTSAGVATFSGVNHNVAETIYIRAAGSGFSNACSNAVAITDSGYSVQIDSFVDVTDDSIIVTSSLLQNGVLVTDNAKMTLTKLEILNNAGTSLSGNLNGSGTTVTDATNSIYHTTWDPLAGLSIETSYSIVSEITYDGIKYSGFKPFNVGREGAVAAGLKGLDTKLDSVQTTVTSVDATADDIETDVGSLDTRLEGYEAKRVAHRAKALNSIKNLKTKIGTILIDTSKTIPGLLNTRIATELAKGDHSEIVTTQATVKSGAKIPFRYRTATGLAPTITVFDPKEGVRINKAAMKEVGGTGIYLYNLTFAESWGLGNFMVRVDETTKQSVDNIVLNVIKATTDSTTSTATSSSAVSLDTLFSRMNTIDTTVTSLSSSVTTVKDDTSGVGADIDTLLKKVSTASSTSTETVQVTGDSKKLSRYLDSVSSAIGSSGSSQDLGTILGKLNNIETTLDGMGSEAGVAADFNENAREKAERIRSFVTMVMKEMKDTGEVKDSEEKVEILEEYLVDLKTTVEEIPTAVTTGGVASTVTQTLEDLDWATSGNAGLQGLSTLVKEDLSEVTEVKPAQELEPGDVLDMRNEVNGLKSLMLEVRGLLDEEVNAPVVHGWLEGE